MSTDDEAIGCAALLAGLPGLGPRRLTSMLSRWGPVEGWRRAISGRADALRPVESVPEALVAAWAAAGAGQDPHAVAVAHHAAAVRVLLLDDPAYPEALAADVEPPAVLFVRGDLDVLERPRVAIVGTRRCTGVGAGMARELGHDLAAEGVAIVSGLALGIDGASHRGVLDALAGSPTAARPAGVVGSGLDVVYPNRHRDLWDTVAREGVLLGEAPLGSRPAAWRFPARNRVIAALADVVVVVESHAAGGSLLTVNEALRRDVQVMAVPGSVRSPAAAGTNQLLADGGHPVRDAADVLVALGLSAASGRRGTERRPTPDAHAAAVLDAFDWEPATLEHLAVRTGLPVPALATSIEWLVSSGWVALEGGWYERVAAA